MRANWQRKALHMFLGGILIFSAIPSLTAAEDSASTNATQIAQRTQSPQSVVVTTESAGQVAALNLSETKISREEAIKIAVSVFTIPEGYQEPEVSLDSYRYDMKPVWEIRWRKDAPEFNHINVSVDANTGMILNYYQGGQNDEKSMSFPPKVNYEEAVSIAKAFINKVYGDKAAMFQYLDDESQRYGKVIQNPYDRYQVRFISMINGVPFPDNSINVGVNSNGEVRDMYTNFYDNVQFAPRENIKSDEEMMKLITENTNMKLVYQTAFFGPQSKENEIVLAYQPIIQGYWDAVSGKAIDYAGKPIADKTDEPALLADEKQADPPAKREQLITEQEAIQILEDQFDIPEGITINSISKDEKHYATSGPVWSFHFEYRYDRGSMGWTGAAVDAETGKVISFELSPYLYEMWRAEHGDKDTDNEKNYKLTIEQAKEKALQYMRKNNPEKLHQLRMANDNDAKTFYGGPQGYPMYRFLFTREINGISFTNNHLTVAISGIDGDIIDFNENWDWDAKFPQADNVIPAEQAKDVYLADKKIQLMYHVFGSSYEMMQKGQKLEAKLAYRLVSEIDVSNYIRAVDGLLINAETGNPVSLDGEEEGATDTKGHWAEKELAYMMKLQIIKVDDDGNIHPDRNLTRGAFIDLFAKLTEPHFRYRYYGNDTNEQPIFKDVPKDHEYYNAIQWAAMQELVEKTEQFAPDQEITREEMAKFIVTSMGLDTLANQPGLFNLRFTDAEQIDYPGHVAIVDSIGIMKGNDNKFRPDDPVTLAQAAKALTIYMNERGKFNPRVR